MRHLLISFILTCLFPFTGAQAETASKSVTTPKTSTHSAQVTAKKALTVNINAAPAEELAGALYGIGQKKAQAIVDFRKKNGPFAQVQDLVHVKGIGPAFLEKNKGKIVLK